MATRKIWRSSLAYGLLSVALAWGGVGVAALPASASAGATVAPDVWQSPEQVPGLATLNAGDFAGLSAVSCTGPGECAGGGFYTDGAGHIQSYVVDERRGVWDTAQEVPGSAVLNAGGNFVVNAISCASPGYCAAGGNYTDGTGNIQAWIADEVGEVWGDAQELPGTAALNTGGNATVSTVSCASPGYCAAGGSYSASAGANSTNTDVFVASEVQGTWSAALEVAGTDATNATLNSVSCGSAGDCVAGGRTGPSAYTVTETSGTWGTAQTVAGTAALQGSVPEVTAVSCEPSGCDAAGMTGAFSGEGFAITETGGTWGSTWGNAVALPLPVAIPSGDSGSLRPQSLSCTSPGDCMAAGNFALITSDFAAVDQEGVTAEETSGSWGAPQTVPSLTALDTSQTGSIPSVSCPAPGQCAAVGVYGNDSGMHGAVLSETSGAWGIAKPVPSAPGQAVSGPISCGAVGFCSVGGAYSADSQHYQATVMDETPVLPTTTAGSLSAARVPYGREQAEKVSVMVSAALGIVPGMVTVTSGGKTACTATLADGRGACTIPATRFGPGSHAIIAVYRSAPGFAASSSAGRQFRVVRAATKTALARSAGRVRFGHERAEKLTARVTPRYAGVPGGKVTIMAGRIRVCVITLKHGMGHCRVPARKLRAGRYWLRAAYSGNPDFRASGSPGKRLTVTR